MLDSSATFHVTPNLEWYSNYTVKTSRTIRLGNGHECKIALTREVPIQLPNGNTITLHQVQHVPTLKRSMVSINMLAEDGYRTTLNESTWMITRGNLRIGSGHKFNNLYPLMVINPEGIMNIAEKTDLNLWHSRLNHMSQAELDWLMSVNYITKLQEKTDFYEHCRYGKQTRSLHTLHYDMVRNPLELIHSDICRSMPERSLGGSRYFITFVDDCTRKV